MSVNEKTDPRVVAAAIHYESIRLTALMGTHKNNTTERKRAIERSDTVVEEILMRSSGITTFHPGSLNETELQECRRVLDEVVGKDSKEGRLLYKAEPAAETESFSIMVKVWYQQEECETAQDIFDVVAKKGQGRWRVARKLLDKEGMITEIKG